MAKTKTTKTAKPSAPLELRYTLAELPSSQHRAGLAGLAFMVEWLRRQPSKKQVGLCQVSSIDARGLTLRIDEAGMVRLFNEVYGASYGEQRSTSEWKSKGKVQAPLRIDEVTTEETKEVKGKIKTTVKTTKYYIYPVVIPRGAFLFEWDKGADKAGNGPWVKLWRDMVWEISRPKQRIPYNKRADGSHDVDAKKTWASLAKGEGSILPRKNYLGAQALTAEDVPFQDRARFQFLLHFWTFVAQIYVPHKVDNDGKVKSHGFAIAVPDVGDLASFVTHLPEALKTRDPEIRGYRPRQCSIDLSEEAGLDFFARLQTQIAGREGARETSDLVMGIDVFHLAKKGNNVPMLGASRVDPDTMMSDAYQAVRGQFWNHRFRQQRIANLIQKRPWHHGFDRICATTAWAQTIGDKYFRRDAREAFKGVQMTDNDNEPDNDTTPTIEGVLYKMVSSYVARKVKAKHDLEFNTAKAAGKLDELNTAREKVARDAFLAARSRTGADFVDFFTSTICSTPQHMKKTEYELIAHALLQPDAIEQVRTLTLLALSARS